VDSGFSPNMACDNRENSGDSDKVDRGVAGHAETLLQKLRPYGIGEPLVPRTGDSTGIRCTASHEASHKRRRQGLGPLHEGSHQSGLPSDGPRRMPSHLSFARASSATMSYASRGIANPASATPPRSVMRSGRHRTQRRPLWPIGQTVATRSTRSLTGSTRPKMRPLRRGGDVAHLMKPATSIALLLDEHHPGWSADESVAADLDAQAAIVRYDLRVPTTPTVLRAVTQ